MTLEELQAAVEKRGAAFVLVRSRRRVTVTLSEEPDHADSRNARPSDRWYGMGNDARFEIAVAEAIKAYDDSMKR